MPLTAGTRLGPYEIVAPLGAGGMGEVFRARDSQLHREVALKVLPAALAADEMRVKRFKREAQLLAALNHPGIAAIYGIAEHDGLLALVRDTARRQTEEFVETWLKTKFSDGGSFRARVVFADEAPQPKPAG